MGLYLNCVISLKLSIIKHTQRAEEKVGKSYWELLLGLLLARKILDRRTNAFLFSAS